MTAEKTAVTLMPPRRLRAEGARQGTQLRPCPPGEVRLPAYVCGFGRGPARPCAEDKEGPARPAQTVCRPYEPANGAARRSGAAYARQAARRRAMLRAHRTRRRLAALLMLAGLFAGLLALRGLAPGFAGAAAGVSQGQGTGPADAAAGAAQGQDTGPAADTARILTLMLQQPALPNGCETVSLAMLLDRAGCPADPVELFGAYIPHEPFQYAGNERYGPDPEAAYAGNAASERGGWYCFEGPVVEGANAYLSAYHSDCRARAVTGLDREGLAGYLDAGLPLAVWVTRGYEPPATGSFSWLLPNGSRYTPYTNLHCVVLAGQQEDGRYQIADPLDGWQAVDPEAFWQSFEAMGCRAVVVE